MQLYTLTQPAYRLNDLIEGYDSLIWTERYRPAGDFELKTAEIESTMKALPIDTLVSLLDTEEVMIVETHDISDNEEGEAILTITGRSFESFYEHRTTLINYTPSGDTQPKVIVTNATAIDAAGAVLVTATSAELDTNCNIPNHNVTVSYNGSALPESDRYIERGQALPVILKILEEENLGIRNNRPDEIRSTLDTNLYTGRDLTDKIILDVEAGHFVGPVRYLWSHKDYKTTAYVASRDGFTRAGTVALTGLKHRMELIDITDIIGTGDTVTKQNRARGNQYLGEHRKTRYIEGTVAIDIPYKFGYEGDYLLGDTIWVRGKYGISVPMMVVEYIRTEDKNGIESGYPTLS